MREILFRGKRTDGGGWVHGSYVECKRSWHKLHPHKAWIVTDARSNGGWFAVVGRIPVINETVGQFTGLKDLNGTPVYEGDIFEVDKYVPNGYDPPIRGVIKFGRYSDIAGNGTHVGFFVSWNVDLCLRRDIGYWIDRIGTTIIGNIHDNPELMEYREGD